jgi:hypothetical protein
MNWKARFFENARRADLLNIFALYCVSILLLWALCMHCVTLQFTGLPFGVSDISFHENPRLFVLLVVWIAAGILTCGSLAVTATYYRVTRNTSRD